MSKKKPPVDEDDDLFGLDLPPPPRAVIPPPPPPKPKPAPLPSPPAPKISPAPAPPKAPPAPLPAPPPPPPVKDTPEHVAAMKWFEECVREHGHHPRSMFVFPKLVKMLKAAKIKLALLTPPFVARIVTATLPVAKEHAARHNASPKRLGYLEIDDTYWLSYGSTFNAPS